MSRVGKNKIAIPSGIDIKFDAPTLAIKGNGKEILYTIPEGVMTRLENNEIEFSIEDKTSRVVRSMWGTTRNNVSNIVKGMSQGFTKSVELNGVGYRAAVAGQKLTLQLGYSHDIVYEIPAGITVKCEKPTLLVVSGDNKQLVGSVVSRLMRYRKPEPYKGKGVIPQGHYVVRKEGKKK